MRSSFGGTSDARRTLNSPEGPPVWLSPWLDGKEPITPEELAMNEQLLGVAPRVVVDADEVPEEIIVVPTLQEARDIIEMEEIERDLGI